MDNTYIFTIENLRTVTALGYDKFVVDISYKVTKTVNGIEGYTLGLTRYECIPDQTIVPFDQLTEEKVIGWVKAGLTDTDNQMIESSIAAMIERLANPAPNPEVTPLPW
jgi:hypothetical protein